MTLVSYLNLPGMTEQLSYTMKWVSKEHTFTLITQSFFIYLMWGRKGHMWTLFTFLIFYQCDFKLMKQKSIPPITCSQFSFSNHLFSYFKRISKIYDYLKKWLKLFSVSQINSSCENAWRTCVKGIYI